MFYLIVNLQLCQLAEFHEITGFAIRLHEDNKRLLQIKVQEGKVIPLILTELVLAFKLFHNIICDVHKLPSKLPSN